MISYTFSLYSFSNYTSNVPLRLINEFSFKFLVFYMIFIIKKGEDWEDLPTKNYNKKDEWGDVYLKIYLKKKNITKR